MAHLRLPCPVLTGRPAPWIVAALALLLCACGGGNDDGSRVSSVVGSMGLQRSAPGSFAAQAASAPASSGQ